ncbi:Uncharacterized conserved protein, DUF302 family [Chitinophaga eiseniae]|uniref:Uncharacterized conserved protein, DUF302 family n=1 Tax=Chitinophaga eiseniae TaxID=634771 RepID=A0A1T4SYE1_9BACT|nr:DUF302 domain-containing protein [Chitinophaga eiseniae]SKA33250.1 Uncharacterized conserved protein, DUF302 family [Chitinophaga eiseniae]
MKYYFNKKVTGNFEDVVQSVIDALSKEGFGILTEIDIKATLKKKLGEDFYNYKILGACNPPFAYQALLAEDKIGTMLPCNIIVQEKKPGTIEVSAINPIVSMKAVLNKDLHKIAAEIRNKLKRVLEQL